MTLAGLYEYRVNSTRPAENGWESEYPRITEGGNTQSVEGGRTSVLTLWHNGTTWQSCSIEFIWVQHLHRVFVRWSQTVNESCLAIHMAKNCCALPHLSWLKLTSIHRDISKSSQVLWSWFSWYYCSTRSGVREGNRRGVAEEVTSGTIGELRAWGLELKVSRGTAFLPQVSEPLWQIVADSETILFSVPDICHNSMYRLDYKSCTSNLSHSFPCVNVPRHKGMMNFTRDRNWASGRSTRSTQRFVLPRVSVVSDVPNTRSFRSQHASANGLWTRVSPHNGFGHKTTYMGVVQVWIVLLCFTMFYCFDSFCV